MLILLISILKKIKLFVDAHVLEGKYQGTSTFIIGLYTSLLKNHNLDIYFGINNKYILEKYFKNYDYKIINYYNTSKYLRLLFIIPFQLIYNKIEYAHFQYIVPPIKVCRYIVTIHDVLFLDYPKLFPFNYKILNKILFKTSSFISDSVTTVSDYSKDRLSLHFNIDKNHIVTTPNGIDLCLSLTYKPYPKLLNKKYILYVSRIEPRKNHISLLKAWKNLRLFEEDIFLVFVGSEFIPTPELKIEFENLSTTETSYFIHIDQLSHEHLNWVYYNCLLFAYPSFAEGFGLPILEAMQFNCKIIISNTSALKDFVPHVQSTFNPHSYHELEQSIMYILNNDILTNYHDVLEKYQWYKTAITFNSLLSKQ